MRRQRQCARNKHAHFIVRNVYVRCLCRGAEINKFYRAEKKPSDACSTAGRSGVNVLFLGWRKTTKCITGIAGMQSKELHVVYAFKIVENGEKIVFVRCHKMSRRYQHNVWWN